MNSDLPLHIRRAVIDAWGAKDPGMVAETRVRPDGLVELTVITTLFESQPPEERERSLWSLLREFPSSDMLRMTYSLLLTPSEAASHFAQTSNPDGSEDARKDSL